LTRAIAILRTRTAVPHNPTLLELAQNLEESRDALVNNDESVAFGLGLDKLKAHQEQGAPAAAMIDGPPSNAIRQEGNGGPVTSPHSTGVISQRSGVDVLSAPFSKAVRQIFYDGNYYQSRSDDPRFQYLDWLDLHIEKLHETANDLESKRSSATRVKAAQEWSDDYENERSELAQKANSGKSSTLGTAAASTVVGSVLTVFFTSFSNWLWPHVAGTLLK
jgi:hypothetical protein